MDLELLGRPVRVTDLDPDAVERFVTECIRPAAAGGWRSAGTFGIRLRGDGSEGPHLDLGSAVVGPWQTRHLRVGPDEFWVVEAGGGVHGTITGEGAELVLHGRPFTARRALHAAFAEAMTASGLLRLHAAAMGDSRRTVALLGPSGRGKSTTVLRGLLSGWRPIAEDGFWLDPASLGLVRADRFLRLRPDGVELLRAARPDIDPGSLVNGRHEIDLDRLGDRPGGSPLTDLVLLERVEDPEPRWAPLEPSRAVMALHQAAGIPHTARAGAVTSLAFGALVDRVRLRTLVLGAPSRPLPPLPADP